MYSLHAGSVDSSLSPTMRVVVADAVTLMGCRHQAQDLGERVLSAMRDASDCLPDITLIDRHGRKVSTRPL
jgi:hypothetical protein